MTHLPEESSVESYFLYVEKKEAIRYGVGVESPAC